jgi:hypothetical protein
MAQERGSHPLYKLRRGSIVDVKGKPILPCNKPFLTLLPLVPASSGFALRWLPLPPLIFSGIQPLILLTVGFHRPYRQTQAGELASDLPAILKAIRQTSHDVSHKNLTEIVPESEITLAKTYRTDFLARYSESGKTVPGTTWGVAGIKTRSVFMEARGGQRKGGSSRADALEPATGGLSVVAGPPFL